MQFVLEQTKTANTYDTNDRILGNKIKEKYNSYSIFNKNKKLN